LTIAKDTFFSDPLSCRDETDEATFGDQASYADRYHILCKKMMQENLYDAASILIFPKTAGETGDYTELDEMTGLRTFVTQLAGHGAAAVAI
jgi:hypothetical protein